MTWRAYFLLLFHPQGNEIWDSSTEGCFKLQCYFDGWHEIVSHLFSEKYFDMNRKNARDALDIYKKFLIRMDKVAEFLKVAEVHLQGWKCPLSWILLINGNNTFSLCYWISLWISPSFSHSRTRSQKFGIDKADIPDLARVRVAASSLIVFFFSFAIFRTWEWTEATSQT